MVKTCLFLGSASYDFSDATTKKQIVGTSYRFLINGHETKIKPAKGALVKGCDLNPVEPVVGELEFDLDSYRGEAIVRFSLFTAKK